MPAIEFFGLFLVIVLGWYWFDGLKAHEAALLAARQACQSEALQLLDATVALASQRLVRDDEGRLRLRRIYDFEYSDTGNNRRRGSVTLLGSEVIFLNIGLRLVPSDRTLH